MSLSVSGAGVRSLVGRAVRGPTRVREFPPHVPFGRSLSSASVSSAILPLRLIVGYVDPGSLAHLLEGLKRLEYRGYIRPGVQDR